MGKILFITEKPSVAVEFAHALGVPSSGRRDGYIESGDIIITWCVGHLITMSYPETYDPDLKKWSMESLPFIPKAFRYEVIDNVGKQYKVVAKLLNRPDISEIYYSGDSAREGEYIQRLVREYAGHNQSASEYRVWIDSQTEEEILRGIREAKPLSVYDLLSDSAYARAIEDYLVGMNFSRVLSLKYARIVSNASGGKYHPIAVGRVMSCVLGMIVSRERAIRDTRIVSFYTIQADLGNGLKADWKITAQSPFKNTPQNYNDIGLLDKIPVAELTERLNHAGSLQLKDKSKSKVSKYAPLLFNLAELQSECSKLFKISPAETLAIAQSLYEKKLTTYPRTDARVLIKAITRVYTKNISGLEDVSELSDAALYVLTNKMHDPERMCSTKYVDDSKVSDHYAIIPTGQTNELKNLSPLEKEVYLLIARRFLSIFYPPAVYEKYSYALIGENETFTGAVTRLVSEGYLAVAGRKDNQDDERAFAAAEQLEGNVPSTFEIKEGKSKPPARYTTGSMILAMENAGNLIEDPELREQIKGSGIGTSATRASVIEKLEKNQYIRINKKSQVITPDALGEMIYDVLVNTVPNILNPKYTASWEKGLQGIVDGTVTKDYYLNKIYDYIRNGVNTMKNTDYTENVKDAIIKLSVIYPNIKSGDESSKNTKGQTSYICPICGKMILQNEKGYYCSGYKDGCRFSIQKIVAGKVLPDSAIVSMINTWMNEGPGCGHSAPTRTISGFKFKNGTGKAKLQITLSPGEYMKTKFVFDSK